MPLLESLIGLASGKEKTAVEVIAKLTMNYALLEEGDKREKALDGLTKYLAQLKVYIYGDEGHNVSKESVLELARDATTSQLLHMIVKHLNQLSFETRKDAAACFSGIVRIKEDTQSEGPGVKYVLTHAYVLEKCFYWYDEPTVALVSGGMLRDCLKEEALARLMLNGPLFMSFFEKVELANFEIASNAFSNFKDLLTRHKGIVATYLQEHYVEFFAAFMKLLQSSNFVTRRQSLKLLGELLLDRSNVKVMVKFVSEVQHLMQLMLLLKDSSRSIQFEAFHVFKVFVANPNKPQPIVDILANNREKLLKYLEDFHTEKDEDEQFKEEKALLIREISVLGGVPASASSAPAPAPAPPQAQRESS